eukprot:425723-Rhodomonas_salina.4
MTPVDAVTVNSLRNPAKVPRNCGFKHCGVLHCATCTRSQQASVLKDVKVNTSAVAAGGAMIHVQDMEGS